MSWKPIKGMENLGPPELARRMQRLEDHPDARMRTPTVGERAAAHMDKAEGIIGIKPRVPAAAAEDLAVERIAILEMRVDRLEEAVAAGGQLYREAGKTGKTTEKLVSPAPDEGEADRRKRWREANREKIRVRDRARKAQKRAEAGQ